MTTSVLLAQACQCSLPLLEAGIAAPVLAAILVITIGCRSNSLARAIALAGFCVSAMVSGWALLRFNSTPDGALVAGYALNSKYSVGLDSFGIFLKFGLNGISAPLYFMAGIVGLAAGLHAAYSKADRLPQYLALLLIMQGGLMGIFSCPDVIFFYLFHEVAMIPTFIMMLVWGGRGRASAAIEMAAYLTFGAMIALAGLLGIYVKAQVAQSGVEFDFPGLVRLLGDAVKGGQSILGADLESLFACLLIFGFGILVSLFPFHSWAPRTYSAAPTAAAMLHAGVLKKFGLYALIQLAWPLLPTGFMAASGWLAWLALGNVILIGIVTISQSNLRDMVGFSSVMHMGYAFLGLATASVLGVGGAVLMMFGHGLSAALSLMLTQYIHARTNTFEMKEMGGLGTRAPVLFMFFSAATFAGVGLPGFANFWGELAIFSALWQYKAWLCAAAATGIVISAVYALRASAKVFMGPQTERSKELVARGAVAGDLSFSERVPAGLLLGVLFIVGFWPGFISQPVNKAVESHLGYKDLGSARIKVPTSEARTPAVEIRAAR